MVPRPLENSGVFALGRPGRGFFFTSIRFNELPQVALFGTLFVSTLGFALIGDLIILPSLLAAGGKFFHPLGRIRVRMADHDATPDDPTGDTFTGDETERPASTLR